MFALRSHPHQPFVFNQAILSCKQSTKYLALHLFKHLMIRTYIKHKCKHQHQRKAACHILSKRLQKVRTYICLIQKTQFYESRLRGINSVDSQLLCHRECIRPRAAVFIKRMQCRIVTDFVTRDLVALQINISESGDQKYVVVCSAYFPSDSGTQTPIILCGAVQMSTQGERIYVSMSWHRNPYSLIKEKHPRLLRG